jgi:hypothetical protein
MKSIFKLIPLCFCAIFAAGAKAADVDYSTPKAAAKALLLAMDAGDLNAAKEATIIPPGDEPALAALVDYGKGFRQLSEAVATKFGKDSAAQFPRMTERAAALDQATQTITGDSAKITGTDGGNDMALKKLDGKWKVDIFADPKFPGSAEAVHQLESAANALSKVAAATTNGAYKSVDEVGDAFIKGITESMQPTTAPADATQPGN